MNWCNTNKDWWIDWLIEEVVSVWSLKCDTMNNLQHQKYLALQPKKKKVFRSAQEWYVLGARTTFSLSVFSEAYGSTRTVKCLPCLPSLSEMSTWRCGSTQFAWRAFCLCWSSRLLHQFAENTSNSREQHIVYFIRLHDEDVWYYFKNSEY